MKMMTMKEEWGNLWRGARTSLVPMVVYRHVAPSRVWIPQEPVGDVRDEHEVWQTQEEDVEQPEAKQGNGGEQVEANVGAARLDGIADEALLLITEEGEAGQQDHNKTYDHHQQPPGFTLGGGGVWKEEHKGRVLMTTTV